MYLLKKKRNNDFCPLNEIRERNSKFEIRICTKILLGILGEGCKKGCDVIVAGGSLRAGDLCYPWYLSTVIPRGSHAGGRRVPAMSRVCVEKTLLALGPLGSR